MKRIFLTLALALLASCGTSDPNGGRTTAQGWTDSERNQFYTGDQGSRIMKTSWMVALKRPDGQPFLGDQLNRYGYLSNELRWMPISGPIASRIAINWRVTPAVRRLSQFSSGHPAARPKPGT